MYIHYQNMLHMVLQHKKTINIKNNLSETWLQTARTVKVFAHAFQQLEELQC